MKLIKKLKRKIKAAGEGYALLGIAAILAGHFILRNEPKLSDNKKRAHIRRDGKVKRAYDTKEQANLRIIIDAIKYKDIMRAYKCALYAKFHIGHDHKNTISYPELELFKKYRSEFLKRRRLE